jgi:hypothetical protein
MNLGSREDRHSGAWLRCSSLATIGPCRSRAWIDVKNPDSPAMGTGGALAKPGIHLCGNKAAETQDYANEDSGGEQAIFNAVTNIHLDAPQVEIPTI